MAKKIKQALANGAITMHQPQERTQQVLEPTNNWESPSSEPISTALMAAEQELENETMEES